jgi:excisionase family DNA binding protein
VAAAQGQPERLLRTDQAADRLKLTERRIRQLCQEKSLEGIKVGRRKWLIPEAAVRKYLESINQE